MLALHITLHIIAIISVAVSLLLCFLKMLISLYLCVINYLFSILLDQIIDLEFGRQMVRNKNHNE